MADERTTNTEIAEELQARCTNPLPCGICLRCVASRLLREMERDHEAMEKLRAHMTLILHGNQDDE